MVAFLVFGITLSAAIVVFFGAQSLIADMELWRGGMIAGKNALEQARQASRTDFFSVAPFATTSGPYLIQASADSVDQFTKKIAAEVSWSNSARRLQKISLSSLIACAPSMTGNWRQPRAFGAIDIGAGEQATDVFVRGSTAYLSANSSTTAQGDFFVVDASDRQNPKVLSSLNTGPGIMAISVQGNYAYAANSSVTAQLQVIDIHDPLAPFLAKAYKLPGSYKDSGPIGKSIFVDGARAYLGTQKNSVPEFHVIDVSDPLNPSERGTWKAATAINKIVATGTLAYLATPDPLEELKILDVGDLQAIREIGSFNAAGSTEAKSLFLTGKALYMGREVGGNDVWKLDASMPQAVRAIWSSKAGTSVNGLAVQNNLAFAATIKDGSQLEVLNACGFATTTPWGFVALPDRAVAVTFLDGAAYVAIQSREGLKIILPGS